MTDERNSYVGVAPCGCTRHAIVVDARDPEYTAKAVQQMIRDGLRVECKKSSEVRASSWACEKCDPELHQTLLALEAKG